MRIVAQRSLEASCEVDGKITGKIDKGLVLLVGFTQTDTKEVVDYMVRKVLNLRIFDDENGVMNKSIDKENAQILSISQFTLYGDPIKGNRPSYIKALNGEEAIKLYDYFNEQLSKEIKVETGIFGAEMKISLVNDGPITIIIEK
ncbi:MAG: D-tyrosyl-tRNA(Tyr) deacylase [Firmicutes bacterium]|nr:D-tyrosyl-tRNA(Tyr) deacylase [Bacillota bacterium]